MTTTVETFTIGERVTTSGYTGIIRAIYENGLCEVRLESGDVVADPCDLRKIVGTTLYSVKCDDCKRTMRMTLDIKASYAGTRCEECLRVAC